MPGIFNLMRCVGKAAVKNAGKLLLGMMPGGEAVFDIAKDAYEDYCRDHSEAELRAELERVAQVPQGEVHRVAVEIAANEPLELRLPLVSYLDQIPASIRQSLRRPSDPSGTTLPARLSLKKSDDLVPFLPQSLPRFKPGDKPLAADWELVELLGKGGFGEVWKARHLHQSRKKPVALKFCLDPVAAATLRHEAALHDHLDRVQEVGAAPGIVPLLDTFLNADPPCLMYEYIEGGDLSGLIRELHEQERMTPRVRVRDRISSGLDRGSWASAKSSLDPSRLEAR